MNTRLQQAIPFYLLLVVRGTQCNKKPLTETLGECLQKGEKSTGTSKM